jgi:23S rRNA (cytosine1962-C5)-methyltransferase
VPSLTLPAQLRPRLAQGHPWVYRSHLPAAPDLPSGAWVRVVCGAFSAYGVWDAEGSIAVRLFARRSVPGPEWVAERVAEAWEARAGIRAGATTAYRWIYGEADALPGIVVDLYAGFAVVQTYSDSVAGLVPSVVEALHAHTSLQGVLRREPGRGLSALWGRLPPRDLVVEENGILLHADLRAGQKTGLYLDQRDNRQTVELLCAGRTVLDCFCYTGGFALHAARGGAVSVVACDAAAAAVEAAQANYRLNGFDPARHTFLVEDGFALLERLAGEGRRFGIVVLDPPSFARDRASRHTAERAYVRLNRLALRCVEPGGLLASSSCTSQVSPEAFHSALAEAARQAGCRLAVLHDAGQPADHPVPVAFPEARYLKFVVARVLPLA